MCKEQRTIEQVRETVAATLEARRFENKEFIRQIRAGAQDDGPYMIGALAEWEAARDG